MVYFGSQMKGPILHGKESMVEEAARWQLVTWSLQSVVDVVLLASSLLAHSWTPSARPPPPWIPPHLVGVFSPQLS